MTSPLHASMEPTTISMIFSLGCPHRWWTRNIPTRRHTKSVFQAWVRFLSVKYLQFLGSGSQWIIDTGMPTGSPGFSRVGTRGRIGRKTNNGISSPAMNKKGRSSLEKPNCMKVDLLANGMFPSAALAKQHVLPQFLRHRGPKICNSPDRVRKGRCYSSVTMSGMNERQKM